MPWAYRHRYSILTAAIICGMCIGLVSFRHLAGEPIHRITAVFFPRSTAFDPFKLSESMRTGNQFSGVISAVDREARTITLDVANVFSNGRSTIRFAFSDTTQWFSLNYRFDGDVLVSRDTEAVSERDLPPGTLVSIVTDPMRDGFNAAAIAYLRRTTL